MPTSLTSIAGVITLVTSVCLQDSAPSSAKPAARDQATTQPATSRPSSDDLAALAEVINTLPVWTTSGTLTADEWLTLARTAAAFQSLPDGSVARILVIYMEAHGKNLPEQMDDPDPRTRPLLLLATMFDLDHPKQDKLSEIYNDRGERRVQICGGFFWRAIPHKHLTQLQQFALPISWTADGPTMTAKRVTNVRGQSGGPGHYPYEPWGEFHHFVRFYEHRKSFAPYEPVEATAWRDLIAGSSTIR